MYRKKSIYYLGTRVDLGVSKNLIDSLLTDLLLKGDSKIYTLNPEFIVDAYFNTDFQKELNSSDLNIIDGVGLLYGIKFLFSKRLSNYKNLILSTLTGVDLVTYILEKANKDGLSVFLLGGSSEYKVAQNAATKLSLKYPNINFIGYSSEFKHNKIDDNRTIEFIKDAMHKHGILSVDFLLVAYGHKNQEFWIGRNSSKIPAKVSVGVGGSLDYLSGRFNRAPKILRKLGLEWLQRLLTQPSRLPRILKATILFPVLSIILLRRTLKNKN